ncbi:unnamed protein product [Linum tenue]|uniref:Galactose-binding domain-containing protein n=1 Tax=Linum tenue TaxID=586396 RepID=A0AAV0IDZ6_9ROSI|nr:unnamed protein product [Linum tenue]
MMEVELEPRVKPLSYKVKATSRESPSQKASHVLDTDLRSHWSTGTNTKEWILLELDEPCLLSHIRIYNKSVLEWEIAVGLRYKPDTFVKARPRCEAPRRDMVYPMNYTPCRYVRISCLRGNPIAIFFIQLIGVSVAGLEPEFQPVVNHLLPNIVAHKQDAHDMHLQVIHTIMSTFVASVLFFFLMQTDLNSFAEGPEQNLHFLAMLVGPFYPILQVLNEREAARSLGNVSESEVIKQTQPSSLLTVSSNFEPRRSRSTSPFISASSIVFRPDIVFVLLRKAYKEAELGNASRVLHKLAEPAAVNEAALSRSEVKSALPLDVTSKSESSNPATLVDYSNLFGEGFHIPDDRWDSNILNLLDIGVVEEGIFHILFACASQPSFCHKLSENTSDFWSALPLIQALLPALRPAINNPGDHLDESFSQWKQPFVLCALSEIVAMSSSALYRPLLHACAGYLSSFSPSHAKAACVLIDLCSTVLAPWTAKVIAKVDLAMDLLEGLLGTIQGAALCIVRARAALKYIVLGLSGHMDDIMGKYKDVKHQILFLLEMLEPFLDPAICALKSTIAFGDVSVTFPQNQEENCTIALNVLRTAVLKPAVLPYLESEWRHGAVAPSVLLSILEPHMCLPPEIDLRKSPASKIHERETVSDALHSSVPYQGGCPSNFNDQDEAGGKSDASDVGGKIDALEDVNLLFAPGELQTISLTNASGNPHDPILDARHKDASLELKRVIEENFTGVFPNGLILDAGSNWEYFNLQADYFQLVNCHDCELRASEFRHLALDLHERNEIADEAHDVAIDALLLAGECHVNPFFMTSFRSDPKLDSYMAKVSEAQKTGNSSKGREVDVERIAVLEKKRDMTVLELVLEAAQLDWKFQRRKTCGEQSPRYDEGIGVQVIDVPSFEIQSADAITLVRQNQALLCSFLIQRLKKDQQSTSEILMHSLVFLLHSATELYCDPGDVIDIILKRAEYLSGMLASFYYRLKEDNFQLDPEQIHGLRRHWILLKRLVIASSGDEGSDFAFNLNSKFQCGYLIPPSAWIERISAFSCNVCPLVRFLGWMAVSRNAKWYTKHRLFLATDLPQLTDLLYIFSDELAIVDCVANQGDKGTRTNQHGAFVHTVNNGGFALDGDQHTDRSFYLIYPDLCKFFPNLRKQFKGFAEDILEAVGLQLRSLSSSVVPDILCWFSDLCTWPFFSQKQNSYYQHNQLYVKGYVAKNAKAIILYILESIVKEHMEAMVPEVPKAVQVLVSICRSSYYDVSFLDSVLQLLKPIISYSLRKASEQERAFIDDSCINFELLCFGDLLADLRRNGTEDVSTGKGRSRALNIFALASVFGDLSVECRRNILQSLVFWVCFTSFESTTSFHDYLCALQAFLVSCKNLLVQTLRFLGFVPVQLQHCPKVMEELSSSNHTGRHTQFLNDVCFICRPVKGSEVETNNLNEDIEGFCSDLENLIVKLHPNIEPCWNLHQRLAKQLTVVSSECFVYLHCLSSVVPQLKGANGGIEIHLPVNSVDDFPEHWTTSLEKFAASILELQENHCWEVASLMLDCLLEVPYCLQLDNIVSTICSAILKFSSGAPKLTWRMQSDKWLSMLFARNVLSIQEKDESLAELFVSLLGNPEPEQRFVALRHLGRLLGLDLSGEAVFEDATLKASLGSALAVSESFLSFLVSRTWDRVVLLASTDKLLPLRTCSMALLLGYVPHADKEQLQSFLVGSDSILHVIGKSAFPTREGQLLRLSLALLASVCLHSPAEDVSLIPENVWRNVETVESSRTGELEKNVCRALCRVREDGDEAKEVLRRMLSENSSQQLASDFGGIRESILQVFANLSSVQSYFDVFSDRIDQEKMELEEAEVELDIIEKGLAAGESLDGRKEERNTPLIVASAEGKSRLQQIKNHIRSFDRSKLQEDVIAHRQRKLIMRQARQKYKEAAALREEELLRELDSQRTSETEKEIERQRLLEVERAKTRELRHNLEIEKERQAQRELQRELEQAESGLRSSRRDFPSAAHTSRSRDRYRDRENGRQGNDGGSRTSTAENASTSSSMGVPPAMVFSGGPRSFSGQPPTILQSRDRQDDCGSGYEENFEGSRDSGDTNSVGDPELMSAFDGQSGGGFGSGQRQGSRGSKSKQSMERREREGRREGKWERKH